MSELISATSAAEFAQKLFGNGEYTRVIEMVPKYQKDLEVLFYAALSMECIDRTKDAVDLLEKIIVENPAHEDALRTLIWHHDSDEYKQLVVFELLAKTGKLDADDMCRMAELYARMERFNIAHYWFQRCLELEPKNCLALLGVAQLYARLTINYTRLLDQTNEIDMNEQLADERDVEDVLRFVYGDIIHVVEEDPPY